MKSILRKIAFPLSLLYGGIVAIRNFLYSSNLRSRYLVPRKSIVIGNLAMGGTGKTPMTAYIIQLLEQFDIQVISRGYGRKTKGFREVLLSSHPHEVGDEPLLLKKRYPDTSFAVCEKRKIAIENIERKNPPAIYLFDDAFQHLAIQAEKYILLTTFQQPYFNDFVVPTGYLREFSSGRKRADFVIVTKCPENLSESVKETYKQQLKFPAENIYFSTIQYDTIQSFSSTKKTDVSKALLITGIANSESLESHLSKHFELEVLSYPDHHTFTLEDIAFIHQKFGKFAPDGNGMILTTEKDFVKLSQPEFQQAIDQYPWYYQPITIQIDRKEEFENKLLKYVNTIQ